MEVSDAFAQPINRRTAEHYVWGGDCDGWHLVKQPEVSVIEERMTPGASEVRHHHVHARQFFYALSGELTLEVEEPRIFTRAGRWAGDRSGTNTGLQPSSSDARMLDSGSKEYSAEPKSGWVNSTRPAAETVPMPARSAGARALTSGRQSRRPMSRPAQRVHRASRRAACACARRRRSG